MAPCFRECSDIAKLRAGNDKFVSLWVRIRARANRADVLVGLRYRLPNKDEKTDEVFYKQLAEVA